MVSHDLVDGFIPKNAVKQCNKCRKRVDFTVTCTKYPKRIPHEVLVSGDCPDFELKETAEQKV